MQRAIEIDDHLVVIEHVSGITKVLLTPASEEGHRDVFFDVIFGSNVTLRVSRLWRGLEDTNQLDDTIALVNGWRKELGDAVIKNLG